MTAATFQDRTHPGPAHRGITHALVWIDARDAIVLRRVDDEVAIERLASDVPAHRRSTGHVRHDPALRHGGGGSSPQSAGEAKRQEHLARFVRTVADRIAADDDLTILGPGTVREHLEQAIREADDHHHRARSVRSEPAARLTDRQLVARLSREAGVEPRRRVPGAHRSSGRSGPVRSGRRDGAPDLDEAGI